MSPLEIISGVLLIITCIFLIIIVSMQSNRGQQGLGSLGGDTSESYFSKNTGRTIDAILARWTKILGVVLVVVTIAVNVVSVFFK